MATSVSALKERLRSFLSDPQSEQEFRVWFALVLREASAGNDPELESLAHTIQRAFLDAADAFYTPHELRKVLLSLSGSEAQSDAPSLQPVPQYVVTYLSDKLVSSSHASPLNEIASSGAYNLLQDYEPVGA